MAGKKGQGWSPEFVPEPLPGLVLLAVLGWALCQLWMEQQKSWGNWVLVVAPAAQGESPCPVQVCSWVPGRRAGGGGVSVRAQAPPPLTFTLGRPLPSSGPTRLLLPWPRTHQRTPSLQAFSECPAWGKTKACVPVLRGGWSGCSSSPTRDQPLLHRWGNRGQEPCTLHIRAGLAFWL